MKTPSDVRTQIQEMVEMVRVLEKSEEESDIALSKRIKAKIPQHRQYLYYLETNPSKEFCEKEVQRLSNRLSEIMKGYTPLDPDRFKRKDITAHKKAFEKMWDVPKIKKQLSAVSYILGR